MTLIRIDNQNDIRPFIDRKGELVYSEQRGSLFIKTKSGIVEIGSGSSTPETDPVFTAWLATPPNVSTFVNDAGYLTVESDPIYSASSWFSTTNNSTNWDAAYGWGNHASAGYALTTSLTAVATSGSYSDLSGTPSIPTQVSQLVNDSGYITSSALSGYELLSNKSTSTSLGTSDSLYPTQNAVKSYVDSKVSTLVPTSRTITINGTTQDLSSNRSWTIPSGVSSLNTLTGSVSIKAGSGIDINISGSDIEITNTGSGINIDGGVSNSTYGTLSPIDGGVA